MEEVDLHSGKWENMVLEMNEKKWNFLGINKSWWYSTNVSYFLLLLGRLDFLKLSQCFTVDNIDGQTYNAWSATGWSSIHLTEKNFIGNTSDIPPRRYKSRTYLKSFLSILPMSHPGLIIPVRRHREEEKQRCKYYSSADHHQQKNQ